MLRRRNLIAAAATLIPGAAAADSFATFVAGVKAEASRGGIRPAVLERAFAGVRYNQKVIELDRHQPEFTLTWEQYRDRVVSEARISRGRELYVRYRPLLGRVTARYRVPAGVIMGIWGLESDFGQQTGGFNVIEALATLTWDGRRARFFRSELMDALKILDHGDIAPDRMAGSYAGAMGQPQFMPDSFLKYAVDFSGTGRRDIWNDYGDIFGSVANYLAQCGWSDRVPWGVPARLPAGFNAALAGRENLRGLAEWQAMGVQPVRAVLPADATVALVLPAGPTGEAFLVSHANFQAIRRYNPSDFYCLSVGLIGDRVTA